MRVLKLATKILLVLGLLGWGTSVYHIHAPPQGDMSGYWIYLLWCLTGITVAVVVIGLLLDWSVLTGNVDTLAKSALKRASAVSGCLLLDLVGLAWLLLGALCVLTMILERQHPL